MKTLEIECDSCHMVARPDEPSYARFVSIEHEFGYEAGQLDGSRVEADLCFECLTKLLGPALRVYPPSWALSMDGSAVEREPTSSEQVATLQAEPEAAVPAVRVQDRDGLFSKDMPVSPTVEHVVQYAASFFQSQERAVAWLSNHCPALASAPVKLMDTPKGRQQVITILYGSYYSVYQ